MAIRFDPRDYVITLIGRRVGTNYAKVVTVTPDAVRVDDEGRVSFAAQFGNEFILQALFTPEPRACPTSKHDAEEG